MRCCGPTDILFPMMADLYYPAVEQSGYGNVRKVWTLDRTVYGNFEPAGAKTKEEVIPNVDVSIDSILSSRVDEDIRVSLTSDKHDITNVIVTNIRDKDGNKLFVETSGPRSGLSTIFEVATNQPHISPFGGIEYYKVILRRSQNQGVDI